jgi:hypothetical protein
MTDHPIKITIENGYYVMRSPKDQRLIDELKAAIHYTQRQWDSQQRAWIVHPKAIEFLAQAIKRAGYEVPHIPLLCESTGIQAPITKAYIVEYIGQCKEREDGIISALGCLNAEKPWTDAAGRPRYQWPVEFLESALKEWFERAPKEAISKQTFYQVLCVFESATDQEIKSAHRRLARQWHPDVCKEENASEMFRQITEAHDILRDPITRKRYDAGLFFEREALKVPEYDLNEIGFYGGKSHRIKQRYPTHFRSPLRCGAITAEGLQKLNRFTVSKILSWDDVINDQGQVMISSWNKFTESIEIQWL